jgi:hypothetical protein
MASPPMNDGAAPVTRDQLREELARYPTREDLREELARYPTREELKETLRHELARFLTRDEFADFARTVVVSHEKLVATITVQYEALRVDIARSARAAAEEHRRELGVLDDRYRDLPARVTTLERTVDAHTRDAALHPAPPRRRPRRPPRG